MKPSRRRRLNQKKQKIPHIIFTINELLLLKKALVTLEKRIILKSEPLPNLQFALETVMQVQQKINLMVQQSQWGTEIGFDANEVLILKTALWLYMIGIQMLEEGGSPLMPQCKMLSSKIEKMQI